MVLGVEIGLFCHLGVYSIFEVNQSKFDMVHHDFWKLEAHKFLKIELRCDS